MIKTDAHMAKVKNKLLQAKAEQTAIEERQKQRYPTSRLFRILANPVGRVWQHGVSGMRRSSGRRCKWRRSRSARRSSLADSVQIHQKPIISRSPTQACALAASCFRLDCRVSLGRRRRSTWMRLKPSERTKTHRHAHLKQGTG